MAQKTAVARWDTTIFSDNDISDELKEWCKKYCKKWGFQGEECPSTKKLHFQMRYSLLEKSRKPPFIEYDGKNSPTSNKINCSNFYDYITKDETRVIGPFTDKDKIIYIPRQIRDIKKLLPWQQQVIDIGQKWDTRKINYLYCPTGNIGKSVLVGWCRAYGIGRCLPPLNDYKELMEIVCDVPTSTMYLIDMPRAMKKEKLFSFYAGVETLKDGYAFDRRYRFEEKVFDCPNIFIFSNKEPDYRLLSKDRWQIWTVEEQQLIPFNCLTKGQCHLDQGVDTDED